MGNEFREIDLWGIVTEFKITSRYVCGSEKLCLVKWMRSEKLQRNAKCNK